MEALLTRNNIIQDIVDKLMSGEAHLSYSSISCFKESPKSFIDYKLKARVETDAMTFGKMLHCLILEPGDFENRYFVIDDSEICNEIGGAKPRATNKYKSWYLVQEVDAGTKIIIESSDYKAAQIMAFNVKSNRASVKVLRMATEHEKPIEWIFKNFKFKGIIDGIGEKCVFDLKSCADASPKKFQRDIINMDYYLQAALYLKGLGEMKPYYIIAMDKNNGVSVHQLSDALIEHGINECEKLLDKFNECVLNDSFGESFDFWSERFDGVFTADKPAYLY